MQLVQILHKLQYRVIQDSLCQSDFDRRIASTKEKNDVASE